MWHLHLKVTNKCQAGCNFCIEKGITCKENATQYIEKLDKVLTEMESEDILYSVSVTGGEPLLFDNFKLLSDTLKSHDIKFLTMNTNAALLKQNLNLIDGVFDFVDISRHSVDDNINNQIFKNNMPTINDLKEIKKNMHKTKMRLQCVITKEMTYSDFMNYVDTFSFADDLSFRRLMSTSDIHNVVYDNAKSSDSYINILNNVYNDFNLVEQVLQDYYVYETWERNNKNITFSYSDMNMLTNEEKREEDNICREFILHPNGIFSGSWDYNKKIILP